jgi:hypothetical protein
LLSIVLFLILCEKPLAHSLSILTSLTPFPIAEKLRIHSSDPRFSLRFQRSIRIPQPVLTVTMISFRAQGGIYFGISYRVKYRRTRPDTAGHGDKSL